MRLILYKAHRDNMEVYAMEPILGLLGGAAKLGVDWLRQDQTNEFNAQQAQMNRDFQERMSSTAYQRGMADMRAAGLNPILAYQKGGASSPSGSSAAGVSPQPAPDFGQIAHTAMAKERLMADLANLKEQNLLLKAQTFAAQRDAELKHATAIRTQQDVGINTPAELAANRAVTQSKTWWGDIAQGVSGASILAQPALGAANSAASFASRFGAAFRGYGGH